MIFGGKESQNHLGRRPPLIWSLFLITNCLGMITQIKRHQTFWITTNLPRKTKVPFSKVIIRQFFRLHVSRVYRGFALHLCFTFYEACTKLALVFYNLSSTASVSRELPPLYFLSIFSNYKHPPPLPGNKTVGLAIVGSGWAA